MDRQMNRQTFGEGHTSSTTTHTVDNWIMYKGFERSFYWHSIEDIWCWLLLYGTFMNEWSVIASKGWRRAGETALSPTTTIKLWHFIVFGYSFNNWSSNRWDRFWNNLQRLTHFQTTHFTSKINPTWALCIARCTLNLNFFVYSRRKKLT